LGGGTSLWATSLVSALSGPGRPLKWGEVHGPQHRIHRSTRFLPGRRAAGVGLRPVLSFDKQDRPRRANRRSRAYTHTRAGPQQPRTTNPSPPPPTHTTPSPFNKHTSSRPRDPCCRCSPQGQPPATHKSQRPRTRQPHNPSTHPPASSPPAFTPNKPPPERHRPVSVAPVLWACRLPPSGAPPALSLAAPPALAIAARTNLLTATPQETTPTHTQHQPNTRLPTSHRHSGLNPRIKDKQPCFEHQTLLRQQHHH